MIDAVTVTLVSADTGTLLRYIEQENIVAFDICCVDELTLRLRIHRRDLKRLEQLSQKRGVTVKRIDRSGISHSIRSLWSRPVLLTGIALLILAGLYLPTRIFFVRVEGNQSIPARMILAAAGECGISFGASARDVRSEKMKNALLESIPQLQWAGVNTSGCVATISVKERQTTQTLPETGAVTSIVAVRDGVICDMTVTSGAPVCKIGQAVSKGDKLISGYVDCDRSVRATRSSGEVFASTVHKIDATMPLDFALRGAQTDKIQKISVIFGKKRINFFSGSGILDSSCVKMYEEKYVTLPGGFPLPIVIVTETWIICQTRTEEPTASDESELLSMLARRYVQQQMLAGTVMSQQEEITVQDGTVSLTCEYGCVEMIGREQNEEIIKP